MPKKFYSRVAKEAVDACNESAKNARNIPYVNNNAVQLSNIATMLSTIAVSLGAIADAIAPSPDDREEG